MTNHCILIKTYVLGCDGLMDLAFIIDSSESIREDNPFDESSDNWEYLRYFLYDVTRRLPIEADVTRLAAVTYSESTDAAFHFSQSLNREQASDLLKTLKFRGGNTNTLNAFKYTRTRIFDTDRPNIRNVAVLLSDGISNMDVELTREEALNLRESGTDLITVAVTNQSDVETMKQWTSLPVEKNHIMVDDFRDLHKKVLHLVHMLCRLPPPTSKYK